MHHIPAGPRSELRLADLKGRTPQASRLMNVKVPEHLARSIEIIAETLGASKTEVVVALLNDALVAYNKRKVAA